MALAVRESGKSLQEIADLAGTSKGQVSQWQTEGKVQHEMVKAHVVESICAALLIRPRWLLYGEEPMRPDADDAPARPVSLPATAGDYVRVEQLDAEAGMGDARINDDYPEVIRAVDFDPSYIRAIVGFVPPPGRLVLVTGKGDSMMPTIQPGDVVVVDTGITSFDGDGLYLINMGNGHQIKRLIDKGVIHVASDNREKNGEPFPIPKGTVIGGRVYLRNRIERFN